MDPSVVGQTDQGGLIVIYAMISLILFTVAWYLIKKRQVQIQSILIPWRLRRLPFFHSLLVGKSVKDPTKVEEFSVWCDSTYTVVIKNAEGLFGVIGFELSKHSMKIYQLQGIKGVNVRGVDVGDHLLARAEVIARKLGKQYIRVQPARFHTYYYLDELHSLYPQEYKHQARLRKMYDSSASNRGFEYCRPGYSFWYQKTLRNRVTLARWLRLQVLLFDRQMRKLRKDSIEELTFASE